MTRTVGRCITAEKSDLREAIAQQEGRDTHLL